MAKILLTIQHGNVVFSPPIKDDIVVEWERTGTPGKLKFTTVKVDNMSFHEGDAVTLQYDDKKIFMGYVFTKSRNKEQNIEVTCYDQIRYLKNKYTYVFENKRADQIIKAMCKDYNLTIGSFDNTTYKIPTIAEENKSALDISLSALEDTLVHTGNQFILYDDFGKLTLKNSANMISNTLIMSSTAEDFEYKSSIDDETYNSIVLYYKPKSKKSDDKDSTKIQVFTASNAEKIKEWGTLRYYEEIDKPSIGKSKAKQLLKLYARKTRELKITAAFGDPTVRGGTLIPVKLNVGEIEISNFMLVEKVTHTFNNDHHTMDLTLGGWWED